MGGRGGGDQGVIIIIGVHPVCCISHSQTRSHNGGVAQRVQGTPRGGCSLALGFEGATGGTLFPSLFENAAEAVPMQHTPLIPLPNSLQSSSPEPRSYVYGYTCIPLRQYTLLS